MSSSAGSRASRGLAVGVLGLLLVACSPAASVSSSPTLTQTSPASPVATTAPSQTAELTPSPSPTQKASASVPAAADPAIGLRIAAPYALTPIDPKLEASMRQQFAASSGAFASLIGIGGRQVTAKGSPVALVFVIGLPSGTMTDAIYQSMVSGMASSTHVTLKTTTIAGTAVSTGSGANADLGIYRDGDSLVMVVAPTDLNTVAKALITAN